MNAHSEPKLDPPGAGLPKVELFIARMMFAWRRWGGNRDSFNTHFQQERARIQALINSCDAERGEERILIPRLRGLEDSSRYWSVWMTLDHLRIIHKGMTRIIDSLARGVAPEGAASTAAVKPRLQVGADIVPAYEKSCDELLTTVANIPDLNTSLRYAHPWFGPLKAAGWHALAGGHMQIHRVQIERILQGFQSGPGKSSSQPSA